MLTLLRKLYYRSPFYIQKFVFLIPKGLLFGKDYRRFSILLKRGTIVHDRRNETLHLINAKGQLGYNDRSEIEDFWSRVSFMNKSERFKYQLSSRKGVFSVETGGVTGKPANFLQNNKVWYKELAYIDFLFEYLGLRKNELKLSFRGGEFGLAKEGVWYINPLHREICFSPFAINKTSLATLNHILVKYKPVIWYGYPSAFKSLLTLLHAESISLDLAPKTLLLISESFNSKDIQFLKAHLPKTRITSFYGLSERCVFGFPLDGDITGYKLDTNYSYVELIDESGEVITEEGVLGEIVATTYDNDVMPLVRYRTGDYAKWLDYSKKTIGLIEGKWNGKSLIDKHGQNVSFTAINFHEFDWGKVDLIQFRQEDPGLVTVSINGVTKNARQNLIASLNKRVGASIQFIQNPTNEIVRTNRGKVPLLITKESIAGLIQ